MKIKLYLVILIISLLFAACGQEEEKSVTTAPPTKQVEKPKPPKEYSFQLSNSENQALTITVKDNFYTFSKIKQPIVLVNFFATWCPPCRGMIPHLNNLQSQYQNQLFILGVLLHDDVTPERLHTCATSHKINYFIASEQSLNQKFSDFLSPKLRLPKEFELPLMVMFVNGKYYTHYEGVIPEEMIESDIKQALTKIEGL